jgi:CRP-like cAMP-binding protein
MDAIATAPAQIGNHLLAALQIEDYRRIFPKLQNVSLKYEETLYSRNEKIAFVYFPNSGMISLLTAVEDDLTLEVGLIGKEGMAGITLFLGVEISTKKAIVQGEGRAMRMSAQDFVDECESHTALHPILRRFIHTRLSQVSQSAACYRFHPIEARLGRWLLMTSDRMETDEFEITQEFLSNMLGVRREAVNKAVVLLEHQGLIRHSRGHIAIFDRPGLESATCICYEIMKKQEKAAPLN